MTLTIDEMPVTLPAPVQAALVADAKTQGKPVADVLAARVTTLYANVDLAEVAAIQEGFDDLNAGRTLALEDFARQGQAEREARRARRQKSDEGQAEAAQEQAA